MHLDAPGAQDALDTLWQCIYRSQRKMHRQCEFGRSLPWHLLTGRSVAGHFPSGHRRVRVFSYGHMVSAHFPSGRSRVRVFSYGHTVLGHFPSGCCCVRAFSFWTQPGQGKWCPDDTCYSTTVTLAVKAHNIVANTCLYSQIRSRFQA